VKVKLENQLRRTSCIGKFKPEYLLNAAQYRHRADDFSLAWRTWCVPYRVLSSSTHSCSVCSKLNKWSNNFDEGPHRCLVTPRDSKCISPTLTPSNTRFPQTTQPSPQAGISIGSAVFAGITNVSDQQTDRQTDHATLCVAIGRYR